MRSSKPSVSATMRSKDTHRRAARIGAGRGLARLLRTGAILAGTICAAPAWAQCAAPAERTVALDASLAVPRDRAAGSVLYAADYPLPPPAEGCGDSAAPDAGWGYAQTPHPSYAQDIYRTGVAAVGVRLSIGGRPLPTAEYAGVEPPVAAGDGQRLRVELIKIDEAGTGGRVAAADLPTLVYRQGGTGIAARLSFSGGIDVRAATCNTPSLRIRLEPVATAALAHAGAVAGAKGFELRLNDCPAGLARIGYRLDPLGGVADASAAVLSLDAGASARGLGVQIRDGDGRPLALGEAHWLQAEAIGAGGTFGIPLQAAYYRIGGESLQAGTVTASLTFTISYE